jgi:hypothetical protein
VRLDPSIIAPHCAKAYANVHSASMDHPYALVCCTDDNSSSDKTEGFWSFLSSHTGSYEAALCSDKAGSVFGMKLSSFPSAWILPLIPLLLRMIIIAYQRVLHKVPCKDNNTWGVQRRFILYFFIMNFRGWALYILLNNLEDVVLEWMSSQYFQTKDSASDATIVAGTSTDMHGSKQSPTCWYQDYLYYENQRAKACYGQEFDFSDHVVLFFGQILPVAIFEILFCILVPLWNASPGDDCATEDGDDVADEGESSPLVAPQQTIGINNYSLTSERRVKRQNSRCSSGEAMFGYAAQILLFMGFLYLNVMTFMAVHHTASYFHTANEVVVGYVISLCVQLPLGYLILHMPKTKTRPVNDGENHGIECETSNPDQSMTHRIRTMIGFPSHRNESPLHKD